MSVARRRMWRHAAPRARVRSPRPVAPDRPWSLARLLPRLAASPAVAPVSFPAPRSSSARPAPLARAARLLAGAALLAAPFAASFAAPVDANVVANVVTPPHATRAKRATRAVDVPAARPAASPQETRKRSATARRKATPRKTARARRPRGAAARTVAAVPAPSATTPRSSAALTADLNAILNQRPNGKWGAMVVSLTRGDTLFSTNPGEPLTPASTFKLFTSALALERLGPHWQFSTDVLRDGTLGADGTLRGDLVLRGDGDPALSSRFWPGGREAPMQALAEQVAAAGVKRVTGDLVADASAFESRTIPEGWLTRYAGSGYAAPFSALSLNENLVVVAVYPDGRVLLEPATTGIRVENAVRVVGGGGASLRIYRATDGHVIARGSIGRSAAVRRLLLTVGDPATFTAGALRSALAAKGITIDGGLRVGTAPSGATPVASLKSPTLDRLVAVMNRESINHFAELLFRNAARGAARQGVGSAEAGNALLQKFATEKLHADPNTLVAADGSGLSVLDRITPRAMVQLLAYAHQSPWASAFHASLPVAGESELLRHRMRFTPAQGNLHAKTGTTNEVVGLAGYVTAENGEVLAFCLIHNGADRWNARATIDAMGVTMAGFARQ
jgi:serine-type D-Ala-D-Ala carboxypeptidase/endopeptidase (penicillin-binding protein 4)